MAILRIGPSKRAPPHTQFLPRFCRDLWRFPPAHYIGVVTPPVPEPVSGWRLHLSVLKLINVSMAHD
eukprot:CAMPEP_0181505126 /NCGR_PEP_ID=MMETSP1110-20121109/57890_1 /TAXON_ID=174948 /ORGANISM="Symbiodinium sp., Strain CCMP421" /LENGTH=66 /DNA_ID=CAMNT_0023634087 /DNA_START=79 /DNA_END=276 /DNA_ORIENTATION=-